MGTLKSKFKCDTGCDKKKDVNDSKYTNDYNYSNDSKYATDNKDINKHPERITRYDKYITREKTPRDIKQQSDSYNPKYVSFSDIAVSGNNSKNKLLNNNTQNNYQSMC
jgi:hypothetical protein